MIRITFPGAIRTVLARRAAFAFGLAMLFVALAARPAHAATLTVTNTSNSGAGSLRQAIESANNETSFPGHDTVAFNIPTSDTNCDATTNVCTITPSSALPTITAPATIDGYTQGDGTPGDTSDDATENDLLEGTNAALKIELDGTATAGASGLQVNSDSFTVKGLIINDFDVYGIILGDQNCLVDNSVIEGNFIGTNAAGTASGPGNLQGGVSVCGKNNVVGGTTAAARNVISGNSNAGIAVNGNSFEAQQHQIVGNLIGTNAAGTAAVPNDNGVTIGAVAGGNQVGGTTPASRNIISGNSGDGVALSGDAFSATPGDTIQGNYIGTDVSGSTALPNASNGVAISTPNNNNTIGGTAAAAGNSIAHNVLTGVIIAQPNNDGNSILGNSIFSNGRLGIDLWPGSVNSNDNDDVDSTEANNGQNFPVLTLASVSGTSATISGTLNSNPNSNFRLEFFANASCNAAVPGFTSEQFFGEGQTYIGSATVNTDSGGDASFGPLSLGPVPSGQTVFTATATNTTTNDTSEFSQCRSPAANSAPTATNDSYATGMNQQLNVAAAGVLSNDTDPESNPLTAIEVSPTTSGTLTLNSNGSFTYNPNSGFTGTDSFTYKANDGTADSNVATATINVQPADNTPPTLDTSNDVTPRNGQRRVSRRTNITATFSEPMSLSSLQASGVFTLTNKRNGATVNPASITLSNGGKTATFDPAPPKLARRTKYEVRIEGGSGGAADVAGNVLAADAVWTFTTRRR